MTSSLTACLSLVLLSVGLASGYTSGGFFSFDCPYVAPDDDSFPVDETALRETLASLGRLRLVLRDPLDYERDYTCITLEFPTTETYSIGWHKFEESSVSEGEIDRIVLQQFYSNRVYLDRVSDTIFNTKIRNSDAWLQFLSMDDDFVYVRSCKHIGLFIGWRDARYVFAREHVDLSRLDSDCLIGSVEERYDRKFEQSGVCSTA